MARILAEVSAESCKKPPDILELHLRTFIPAELRTGTSRVQDVKDLASTRERTCQLEHVTVLVVADPHTQSFTSGNALSHQGITVVKRRCRVADDRFDFEGQPFSVFGSLLRWPQIQWSKAEPPVDT